MFIYLNFILRKGDSMLSKNSKVLGVIKGGRVQGCGRMRALRNLNRHEKRHGKMFALVLVFILGAGVFGLHTYQNQQDNTIATAGSCDRMPIEEQSRGIAHGAIHINGNADFANQAGTNGWQGNGSQENPYIIENYNIDGNGGAYCIWIENTSLWFVIRNCTVWNATYIQSLVCGSGIYLTNVTNGTLTSNECFSNFYGIYLYVSSNNTLSNNTCRDNYYYNIYLCGSANCTLINNTCFTNRFSLGVFLVCTTNLIITGNTLWNIGFVIMGPTLENWNTHVMENNTVNGLPVYYYKNQNGGSVPADAGQIILANCTNMDISGHNLTDDSVGIQLGYSHYNYITNNTCASNFRGIYLESSSENRIMYNTCCNNLDGISFWRSHENVIVNNTCTGNNNYGIFLDESNSTIVANNICSQNSCGLGIYCSSNNSVTENYCWDNSDYYGVFMYQASNNSITYNECSGNHDGIFITDSSNNIISNNTCRNNSRGGIFQYSSAENEITDNTCTGNSYGIYLYNSFTNLIITNNNSYNSVDGIYLDNSSYNTVRGNNCSGNSYGISLLSSSNNNIISYNAISSSTHYGIYIVSSSTANIIHHNNFWQNNGAGKGVSGNCQAYDGAGGNIWYDSAAKEGNYWSNWDGSGWGTASAYPIAGGAGAYDMYPLNSPVTPELSPIAVLIAALGLLCVGIFRRRKYRT